MAEKLIITKKEDKIFTSMFHKENLVQENVEYLQSESILGNIYLGKVKNIVKNINAAFVEIQDGRMCYLPLDDSVLPLFTSIKKTPKVGIGDTLVVQIVKEDVKTKAPYATTGFSFTGKYVVLTYGKTKIGVSGKIQSEEERKRLKKITEAYQNDEYGFIIRTNCEGISKERIEKEIKLLIALYENVTHFGIHKTRFSCIYRAPSGFLCTIRDEFSDSLEEIVTEDASIYEEIKEYLNCYQPEDLEKLRFYEDETISLNHLYNIESKISKALQKQVWLKSGGTLVIEPTEALTVIDVNTGKAIKGKSKIQETFRKVNTEAAKEIAKQIRLRNLSGIILVDFIDMENPECQKELLDYFNTLLKKDPVKTSLIDMTALGLVEITRKKVRKPLHEQLKNSII
ncbi:MAG: ribonuclease E/G [Acetivibrio sp.]